VTKVSLGRHGHAASPVHERVHTKGIFCGEQGRGLMPVAHIQACSLMINGGSWGIKLTFLHVESSLRRVLAKAGLARPLNVLVEIFDAQNPVDCPVKGAAKLRAVLAGGIQVV